MLRIPNDELGLWAKELVDECMASSGERAMVYTRAAQYYYSGSYDSRAALHNKVKPFIDRLAGFLMQPTDVRFQLVFDSDEAEDVLKRAELVSQKLSADFGVTDSDIDFADAVTWSLINGCQLLKIRPDEHSFKCAPIHPQNFGVLSETVQNIDEQEAVCHVTFPTISRLSSWLDDIDHPDRAAIVRRIIEGRQSERDEEAPEYLHQLVVGGLQPLGNVNGDPPSAAGIVNVFPIPTPWRPQRRVSRTVRHCELWIKDRNREGDWTTIQLVYPDIIIEGDNTRRNLSRVPGKTPFVKVQPSKTPGYFWGRSRIADVQMLQDVVNKRLRDLKIIWDRNAAAPMAFSGFTGITEEIYYKIMSEGGFINDSNPNAKANPLVQPPPPDYLQELEFLWQMFDEASGFTPIMSGQGEPGVRAGTHAQTLVRTSSPPLITQAANIERQLADVGYLAVKIMQAGDGSVYITDQGQEFLLEQLPENFQVIVDSHSASPAFAEDNMQKAAALFKAGALDAEDLLHLAHLPGTDLFLARFKERQKRMAQAQQEEKKEELVKDVLGFPSGGKRASGGGGRKRG
jgi:hypothetical protein